MSARVNLLPPELEQRRRARRTARRSAAAVGAWVVVLGLGFVVKDGQVETARLARDGAAQRVVELEREVAALDEYAQLASRLDARGTLLSTAMAEEISWARVLNDVSLAFPADASLSELSASLVDAAEPIPGEVATTDAIAELSFSGYSVERFAPGVEGVLRQFDAADGFNDTYLTTAATTERGTEEVTDFTGSLRLDPDARTDRYAEGLPAEVSP